MQAGKAQAEEEVAGLAARLRELQGQQEEAAQQLQQQLQQGGEERRRHAQAEEVAAAEVQRLYKELAAVRQDAGRREEALVSQLHACEDEVRTLRDELRATRQAVRAAQEEAVAAARRGQQRLLQEQRSADELRRALAEGRAERFLLLRQSAQQQQQQLEPGAPASSVPSSPAVAAGGLPKGADEHLEQGHRQQQVQSPPPLQHRQQQQQQQADAGPPAVSVSEADVQLVLAELEERCRQLPAIEALLGHLQGQRQGAGQRRQSQAGGGTGDAPSASASSSSGSAGRQAVDARVLGFALSPEGPAMLLRFGGAVDAALGQVLRLRAVLLGPGAGGGAADAAGGPGGGQLQGWQLRAETQLAGFHQRLVSTKVGGVLRLADVGRKAVAPAGQACGRHRARG